MFFSYDSSAYYPKSRSLCDYNCNHDTELYRNYCVVLFDLLGQSRSLQNINYIVDNNIPDNEKKQFTDKFYLANEIVEIINRSVYEINHSYSLDYNKYDELLRVFKNDKNFKCIKKMLKPNLRISQFSDTFIITFPLTYHNREFRNLSDKEYNELMHINVLINVDRILRLLIHIFNESLIFGSPIRGAISYSGGKIMKNGMFYGPALAEVHYLESKMCNYPRMIISDKFYSYIYNVYESIKYEQKYKGGKVKYYDTRLSYSKRILNSFIFDTDRFKVIDFISCYDNCGLTDKEKYFSSIVYSISKNIKIYKKRRQDHKILTKYFKLRNIVKKRLKSEFNLSFDDLLLMHKESLKNK